VIIFNHRFLFFRNNEESKDKQKKGACEGENVMVANKMKETQNTRETCACEEWRTTIYLPGWRDLNK
jgi:hypothetical protein